MSRANFHASRLDVPLSLRRRDNIAAIVVHIGAVTQEIVRVREFQIKTFLFFQMMSTFHFMFLGLGIEDDRGADKLIMEYLNWFATRYETILDEKTVSAWEQTEMFFNSVRLRRPNVLYVERSPGPLRIHASAHCSRPHGWPRLPVSKVLHLPCDLQCWKSRRKD